MLLPIAGKPLILHTVERAKAAATINRVIVATDNERIFDVVSESGNEAVMTSANHKSGSDRIAEVAESLPVGSIIVNVQGDEPLISAETIEQRLASWKEPRHRYTTGVFAKYAALVSSAAEGAITRPVL